MSFSPSCDYGCGMATTGDLYSIARIDAIRNEKRHILTFGKEPPLARHYSAQPLK